MKVLIMSCNTGQGHNSAANAVGEALERRGAEYETVNALSFWRPQVSKHFAGSLVDVAVHAPKAFGYIYQAGSFISSDRIKSPIYHANKLYAANMLRYIEENGFDAAVCPHLFPAETLTYLRRKSRLNIKCYSVATDYTCIPFLEETDMDTYFLPHGEIADEYAERGIARERLVAAGVPVSAKFRGVTDKRLARERLGLDEEKRLFAVMTGGEGCGNAGDLTAALLKAGGQDANIVVLTGRNAALKAQLDDSYRFEKRVKTVAFTDEVPLYMDACDVLLSKPGGLSCTEAAVKNVALVHTMPIPGCETANAGFFALHGMSVQAGGETLAAAYATNISRDAGWAEQMKASQRLNIDPLAADKIAEYICTH